jgi:transposase
MSGLSIAAYFPFRRIKITSQQVSAEATEAHIQAEPDMRFHPICHGCGKRASGVHSWIQRKVRDLSIGPAMMVWVTCRYRKVLCPSCQAVHIEDLELFHPYLRVTTRLARFVYGLCKVMTVTEVAKHLGLNWKTVKKIDKYYLEQDFGQPDYSKLRILAVDEISIRKGQQYLTVVLDYLTGRIVFVGKDRKARTLKRFFNRLSIGQRKRIEAVAMDMWDPFIKALKKKLPNAKIVFDLFHVVAGFGRVIDKVRNSEYRKASKQDKAVFKGAKYLLLKNRKNVRRQDHRQQLKELLELNEVLSTVYILKEKLKHIWTYRSRTWAAKALDNWCALARSLKHPSVTKFARTLERYRYGILNHCEYPIHTGKIEGVNNKIKVIKRKAYGFHDQRYFALKIYQAFSN